MDLVLKNLIDNECYVYIDDVIIFSKYAEVARLENVLQRFDQANLQLHPGKCAFAQPQVQYLGYVLSHNGVSASADKMKAIVNYPTAKNARDVRTFLGLASVYRKLVPNFAETAKPLTALTRKNQEFVWGLSQQKELEYKLCTTPVLSYPDFCLLFILTADASKTTVAAILSQVQEGIERPMAYASRQTNEAEQNCTASEAEMLALIWATKYFRCYLYGRRFLVMRDHAALTHLRNFDDHNHRLIRLTLKLSEMDFTVEHKAGAKIVHVDALSRHVDVVMNEGSLNREAILREQTCEEL